MRWAMLVIVLLLGVWLTTTVASGSFSGRPLLHLVDRTPVVVRGSGFEAGERVSVALSAGTRSIRRAQATEAGTFVVRFGVSLGRCTGYSLQAYGSAGSRARLLSRVALACISSVRPGSPNPLPLDPGK
jgi:hypothetical protein